MVSILDNKQLGMEGGGFGSCAAASINSGDGMAAYFQLSTKRLKKRKRVGIKSTKPWVPTDPLELIAARSG